MDPRLQEIVAMVLGQNRENPALQGYLSAPNSRPEIESQMGLPAHLRQQQQRPAWAGSLQRPATMISPEELTGEMHPFPFQPQMIPDNRVERLPDRGAPRDPFERPPRRVDGPPIIQEPRDPEPWRQPEGTPQIGLRNAPLPVGTAAPRRGLEPPSAPRGPSMAEQEAQAWNSALRRAQQQTLEDRRAQGRRIPRPGNPLIGQAWSDPDRRRPSR